MIVVDSSAWIEFYRGTGSREALLLRDLIRSGEDLIMADLVLAEVLRGAPDERTAALIDRDLSQFHQAMIGGADIARQAARHFRWLRGQGFTIRKTIDLLIGTFCLFHQHQLLHRDRDFEPMRSRLGLVTL